MSHLSVAIDNSADELDLCDHTFESMFPDVGSDDPAFVRYRCDRCGFVGDEAFGPVSAIEDVREQALTLFAGSVVCQAGC